jgi:predicted RNase H-like HicB family nuclease
VPDLPGCIATGTTITETEAAIREAIEFHLEGLREDGELIPPADVTAARRDDATAQLAHGCTPRSLLCFGL